MDNSRRFTAFHLSHEKTPRTKLRELGHRITGHCVVFGRPRPRLYGTAVAPLGWIGWEVVLLLKGFAFGNTAFQPGSCRTLVSFRLGRGHFFDLQAGSSRDACRVCPILFTIYMFFCCRLFLWARRKRLGLFRSKTVQPQWCRWSLVSLTSMVRGVWCDVEDGDPGIEPSRVAMPFAPTVVASC